MRVAPAVVRLVTALAVVAFVSWRLLEIGALPIAPHVIPLGPQRLGAQAYGVVWWIAVAVGLSAAISIVFATMLRVRGANGHRALPFVNVALGIVIFGIALASLSAFVFEFPISAVFATSSIIAVTLGFAMQHTLADLLSGLAMSIEQPFRVGAADELARHPHPGDQRRPARGSQQHAQPRPDHQPRLAGRAHAPLVGDDQAGERRSADAGRRRAARGGDERAGRADRAAAPCRDRDLRRLGDRL